MVSAAVVLLLIALPLEVVLASQPDVTADVKGLSLDAGKLAKATDEVTRSVLKYAKNSKDLFDTTKAKKAQAEADAQAEVAKLTSDVQEKATAAQKAVDDANAKITEVTQQAAADIADANDSKNKLKTDSAVELAQTRANVAAASAQDKAVLSQKVSTAQKKAADAEVQTTQMATKAANDVASTMAAGTAGLETKVAAANEKATADVEAAKSKASADAAATLSASTNQLSSDMVRAERLKNDAKGKILNLQAELQKGKEEAMNIVKSSFESLMDSAREKGVAMH